MPGGGGDRPASEGIETPGADEILVGLGGTAGEQGVPFRHVAIGDNAESGGPLVVVGGVDVREGFADVGGVETDERVHAVFSALDGLGFDFVEGALFLLLLSEGSGRHREKHETCNQTRK